MDGGIRKHGGRVLPANEVELCWDGNQICALVGPDLVMGVSGCGDAVLDALRDLADKLVKEAVWVEIADEDELPPDPTNAANSSIETNVVELYRDRNRMCALLGTEDSTGSIAKTQKRTEWLR